MKGTLRVHEERLRRMKSSLREREKHLRCDAEVTLVNKKRLRRLYFGEAFNI